MNIYGIVGAGGYGREVIPLAAACFKEEISSGSAKLFFVVEGEVEESEINEYSVISLDEFLGLAGNRYFSIAIGQSTARERIAALCESRGAKAFSVFAENTVILDSNDIGRHFHANIYSYVAHDCVIGDFVTFAPSVKCNGNVTIEDHAYIGTGASIIQGKKNKPLTIGRGAVVGMGAVVTKSVPAGVTVVGNPARPLSREGLRK
jgi:UDP-3-O-[3-hydroxymyristoyl] glucosamine N-acyltransferase